LAAILLDIEDQNTLLQRMIADKRSSRIQSETSHRTNATQPMPQGIDPTRNRKKYKKEFFSGLGLNPRSSA
jgi:hypothetical protein